MAGVSLKAQGPPSLSTDITYSNWKTELSIWADFTDLANEKKGPAVFLSLKGQARESVRQNVTADQLKTETGLKHVTECLDKLYLKDETCSAYEAYEEFEKFVKPSNMSISDYIIRFEQLYSKAVSHKMEILDGVRAYRLLNGAGLSESHKQLVRATVNEMKYENMKEQLKKVFTNTCIKVTDDTAAVKIEQDTFYNQSLGEQYGGPCDTYYGYDNLRGRYNRGQLRSRANYNNSNRKNGRRGGRMSRKGRGQNPKDGNGEITKCNVCESKFHWQRECPDKFENVRDDQGESVDI